MAKANHERPPVTEDPTTWPTGCPILGFALSRSRARERRQVTAKVIVRSACGRVRPVVHRFELALPIAGFAPHHLLMNTTHVTARSRQLRLESPGELVELVPYLLGFHPTDSVVVLALRGPRREISFRARSDLVSDDDAVELARRLAEVLVRNDTEAVAIVVYPPSDWPGDFEMLQAAFEAALAAADIKIVEFARVEKGRWWSLLCADPSCCPADGLPVPTEASGASVVAAEMTYAGATALPSREALVATLQPRGLLARAAMDQATARAEEDWIGRLLGGSTLGAWRDEVEGLHGRVVDRWSAGDRSLSDDDAAQLIVGLSDKRVRDRCLGVVDSPLRPAARELWAELVRRAAPPDVAPPATLLAWAAWQDGEGALANIALDRALISDPTYELARLLAHGLAHGVPPSAGAGLAHLAAHDTQLKAKPTKRKRGRRRNSG